jgi:hypothetical protein
LEESKRCPETETCFVATDEKGKNRGTVRYGDFYEGRVTVIKGSGFVNSSETVRRRSRQSVRHFNRGSVNQKRLVN